MPSVFKFKFKYGDDTRRISFDRPPSFGELKNITRQLFNLPPCSGDGSPIPITLKYEDDENDLVTVNSDGELQEALNVAAKHFANLLKLSVYVADQPSTMTSTSPSQGSNVAGGVSQEALRDMFVNMNNSELLNLLNRLKLVNPPAQEPQHSPNSTLQTLQMFSQLMTTFPWLGEALTVVLNQNMQQQQQQQRSLAASGECANVDYKSDACKVEQDPHAIHTNVKCDTCNSSPIIGKRFKCTVCEDFDVCEKCEAKGLHADHPKVIYAFNVPVTSSPSRRGNHTRPRCVKQRSMGKYVRDISVPDGSQFLPDTKFVKTWRVRNEGQTAWQEQTLLTFVGGDNLSAPGTVSISEVVQPGQEVDVSVSMKTPSSPGRYVSFWRLCMPDGTRFGQRIWTDITVVPYQQQPQQPLPPPQQQQQVEPVVVVAPVNNVFPAVTTDVCPPAVTDVAAPNTTTTTTTTTAAANTTTTHNNNNTTTSDVAASNKSTTKEEAESLTTLVDMGFKGDLLSILRRHGGDLMNTLGELVKNEK